MYLIGLGGWHHDVRESGAHIYIFIYIYIYIYIYLFIYLFIYI